MFIRYLYICSCLLIINIDEKVKKQLNNEMYEKIATSNDLSKKWWKKLTWWLFIYFWLIKNHLIFNVDVVAMRQRWGGFEAEVTQSNDDDQIDDWLRYTVLQDGWTVTFSPCLTSLYPALCLRRSIFVSSLSAVTCGHRNWANEAEFWFCFMSTITLISADEVSFTLS